MSASGTGREAQPDNSPSTASNNDSQAAAPAGQNHRRRRGVGIVTPNACTECRKKRAKCDGNTPCQRCSTNDTTCIYEIPVRQSKETMRGQIEQLETHRRHSERLISSLVGNDRTEETINRLRNGQNLEQVSHWLEEEAARNKGASDNVTSYSSPSHQSAIQSTLKMVQSVVSNTERAAWSKLGSDSDSSSPDQPKNMAARDHGQDAMNWHSNTAESFAVTELACPIVKLAPDDNQTDTEAARGRGQNHILGPVYNSSHRIPDASVWTNVTDNPHLVEHFMSLYFCWEYPTFASLSKEHFLTDFRSGHPRFCSSLLVNAMLALGCRFSSLPDSRSNPDDPNTSGDHYFAEARRLLFEDDHTSLTTIQALGLMSIREASCGKDTESFYLAGQAIRLAVEFGLHVEATHSEGGMDHEVKAATFWGAFALDAAWSLNIGRIPHFSRAAKLVAKPSIVQSIESSEWVPYSDAGIPLIKAASQPSNVRSVFRCFAELSELVHQSLYTLYTPGRALNSSEVVSVYFRYLNWYSSLPEALRLGHNFTPAVLFAHMYYHFAILLTLRPFVKLRFIGSAVSPRDVCSQAADAITTLIRSYDNLYTLARTPSFVPLICLGSGVMHLVIGTEKTGSTELPKDSYRQILQSAHDLKSMAACHGFSRRALDIMRFLAQHWKISSAELPPSESKTHRWLNLALTEPNMHDLKGDQEKAEDEEITVDGLKHKCRMDLKSQNMFCPDLREALPDTGPLSQLALFNPFPMQGLPLLAGDDGENLEANGFQRLHSDGHDEGADDGVGDDAMDEDEAFGGKVEEDANVALDFNLPNGTGLQGQDLARMEEGRGGGQGDAMDI